MGQRAEGAVAGQRAPLGREVPDALMEKLFPAAFACFSEKGFDRTTMDEVAARAGVARATLYYYFRGKDDLFFLLLGRAFQMLRDVMAEQTAHGGSARERLERALERLVEMVAEYRDVATVVLQQMSKFQREWEDEQGWVRDESTAVLRGLLEEGARDGSLRPVDVETVAVAIWGATLWGVLHHVFSGMDVPVERLKKQLSGLILGGLGV